MNAKIEQLPPSCRKSEKLLNPMKTTQSRTISYEIYTQR